MMRNTMKQSLALIAIAACGASLAYAQAQPNVATIVDMELLTHTELSAKIKDGWTSVLLAAGGTEERGPQDVLGGHTMMAKSHADMIARKLGKTLVAPVLPIAVNATGSRAKIAPLSRLMRSNSDGLDVMPYLTTSYKPARSSLRGSVASTDGSMTTAWG